MRIEPGEAARLMAEEGYVYLDVRTIGEWATGHPPGSRNVPYSLAEAGGLQPNPLFLPLVRALFGPSQGLVVACAAGRRSQGALRDLRQAGYERAVELGSGFSGVKDPFGRLLTPGWRDLGLPVAHDLEAGSYQALLEAAGLTA
ncbi:MAG: rhodanese-like domain-containing protein [Polyangiaceae bacterium]